MRDWWKLLDMLVDDFFVYLPLTIFLILVYFLKVETWRLYLLVIMFAFIINIIKWEFEK